MKKTILILLSFLILNSIYSQNLRNLVIVSAENHNFTAYVNQQKINYQPSKMVKVTGLTDRYYNVTIYVGKWTNPIKANLYIPPSSEIVYEFYVANNEFPQGQFLVRDVFPLNNGQTNNGNNTFPWNENTSNNNQQGTINININNNSNSNSSSNANNNSNAGGGTVYVPGYAGDVGCTPPLTSDRFNSMLNTIEKQSFSDTKLKVAKQIISSNCITVNHLVRILKLFSFEDTKLKLAKFSYDYVYDIENYYKVNNVFSFDSSIDELDKYIRNR